MGGWILKVLVLSLHSEKKLFFRESVFIFSIFRYERVIWLTGDTYETVDALPFFFSHFLTVLGSTSALTGQERSAELLNQVTVLFSLFDFIG